MMKPVLQTLLVTLAVAAGAFAQEAAIDKAVMAAPANMRAKAGVIKWKPDFTYETLRESQNGLVCYDISGYPTHRPFTLECTMKGNLPRAAQNLKTEAIADPKARQAAFDEAEKNGTRVKPEFGSVWYHLMGTSQETATTHMTIAVPMATTKTMGLPETRGSGDAVWIMNPGTTTAHLMTPGE